MVDSGRKLKNDLKDKDAFYWKSSRMSKSSSKYCKGTIGIQNKYKFDEFLSKFVSQKHVHEPVENPVVTSEQGIMV